MSGCQVPKGYKQTEEWDSILLGDLLTLQRGFDLPSRLRCPGIIPIVSSSGVIDTHNQSPVEGPGVVTGRYGTIGEVFFVEGDYWPLNTTLFVNDFKENDPLFIYFLLKTIDYKTYSGKSGVPGVNRNDLHEISVKRPPIAEQRSIAQALSDVDALIAALDQLIAKTRHLKTATMQQLLTGKKRLPGFGEGKGYQQSEIGMIPEDWEVVKLGSLGKFKNGINKGSEDFGHGSPFVNLMDVFGISSIEGDQHLGLVNSNDTERKMYDLREGDVLFVRSSVKPSGVGLTAVIKRDLINTVYSGFLIRFRDNGGLDSKFKEYCFSEEKFRQKVIAGSTVSANTNINQDNLKKLLFAYPKLCKEQSAIAQILTDMDTEITALETRRTKTQALKQGMMQELLTGKTRLR
jgi:type I restriction enzyme, S subunit